MIRSQAPLSASKPIANRPVTPIHRRLNAIATLARRGEIRAPRPKARSVSSVDAISTRAAPLSRLLGGLMLFALTGCGARLDITNLAHRIDIPQGNIITQAQVDQLKPGMNRAQVRFIMGSPTLDDAFHDHRWDYLYRRDSGDGDSQQQQLTVYFENDALIRVSGDLTPTPNASTTPTAPTEALVPPQKDQDQDALRSLLIAIGLQVRPTDGP